MTPAQPQLLQAAAWLRSGFMLRNSFALEVPSPLSGGIEGGLGRPLGYLPPFSPVSPLPLQAYPRLRFFYLEGSFFHLPAPSEEPVSF
jgi:hypothetical protein